MKIYLASNYSTHPEMREHAKTLEALGHEITSEWINGTHGGDDRALYAQIDLRDVDAADAIIFFAEAPEGSRTRGGKHVEFGYALAKGKRIFLVGKPVNVFHHLPEVIQRIHFEDLLGLLPHKLELRDVALAVGYCIRAKGHDGPCNGLPRNDCSQMEQRA